LFEDRTGLSAVLPWLAMFSRPAEKGNRITKRRGSRSPLRAMRPCRRSRARIRRPFAARAGRLDSERLPPGQWRGDVEAVGRFE
jgi:hypothetical protein